MKNVNRDYLVTVNAKTADIKSVPSNMQFYITDIHTSNIFFELIFSESTNSLVKKYSENEKASDYKLTLRVLKPDGTPKEIEATQLNDSNFFVADLIDEYKNFIGTYQCELLIEATTNGRQEISTTEPFEYEVVKSIFSDLGEVIEGDPDYPTLIDILATKDYVNRAIESYYLDNYATKNYVIESIADINLVNYATKHYVNQTIENDLVDYATKDYVDQIVLDGVDLSDYATKKYVDEAISDMDIDSDHTHDEFLTEIPEEYVTQEELDQVISDIDFDNLVVTNSISMGRKPDTKIGQYSVATGNNVTASGLCSHAEGAQTEAIDDYSHAEGAGTIASGMYQHVQGRWNIEDPYGFYAHIVGNGGEKKIDNVWQLVRSNAHTLDWDGNAWFAGNVMIGEDKKLLATKEYVDQLALDGLVDLGEYVTEQELADVIATFNFKSIDSDSLSANSLKINYFISMCRTINSTSGRYSVATGYDVTASGLCSHAEGTLTVASGDYSHAEGNGAYAIGTASHAEGSGTIARGYYQHVQGQLNIEDTENKYAHIVGNGTDSSDRSNAHTLDWDGNGWYQGDLYVGGTNQDDANKVLSTADIRFDDSGCLVVTINGTTKRFAPVE